MAANKEAIVIVLDVGQGMTNGLTDDSSPLQQSKSCISMILQRKIFSESKDEIALVLLGSEETANNMADEYGDEYANVALVQDLKSADWKLLQYVLDVKGTAVSADFIDGLVVAMDVLVEQTKGKKFLSQRILLFSNFAVEASDDQIDTIIQGLTSKNMEINVIGESGLEFGDDEGKMDVSNGIQRGKKKPSRSEQQNSEALIKRILSRTNGESYSFKEALPALTYYQKKKTQSAPWNVNLEIIPNFSIPVTGYIKFSECKAKQWKTAYAQRAEAPIEKSTTYHLNDKEQTEVDKENITQAYRYGMTLVPFTKEDKDSMDYKTGSKGLTVLGFTKRENIKLHYCLGDKTHYFIGSKQSEEAQTALSAIIHALHETDMVAVVRYAYSARSAPKLGFMLPRIKLEYECLVFIQLPFMEDVRHFHFSPLDANKKNLPTTDQLKAVDDLLTAMDLSTAETDDDGNKVEALNHKDVVNPFLQRLYQCLQHRAFNPNDPLPEMPDHIKKLLKPPSEVEELAKPLLENIKKLFPLQVIIAKKDLLTGESIFPKGSSKNDDATTSAAAQSNVNQPVNLVNIMTGVTEVGTVKPVENFKHLISQPNQKYSEVCKQLEKVTKQLLEDYHGGALHDKGIACLKSYREESIVHKAPGFFNSYLEELKSLLSTKNKDAWQKIVTEKVTLISSKECSETEVSESDAESFLKTEVQAVQEEEPAALDDDEEDLLEEMG